MKALLALVLVCASVKSFALETFTYYPSFFQLLTLEEQYAGGGEVESGMINYTPFQVYQIDVGSERLMDFTYLVAEPHPAVILYDDGSVDVLEFPLNPTGWHYAIHWFGIKVPDSDPRNITTIYLLPQSPTLLWGIYSYDGN